MNFLLFYLLPITVYATIWVALVLRQRRREWLLDALEEQVRREYAHPVDYRSDQRERAIQQRLSRKLGKGAFSRKTLKLIQKQLHAHDVLGPWHRE